jgi:hypothetical protein
MKVKGRDHQTKLELSHLSRFKAAELISKLNDPNRFSELTEIVVPRDGGADNAPLFKPVETIVSSKVDSKKR